MDSSWIKTKGDTWINARYVIAIRFSQGSRDRWATLTVAGNPDDDYFECDIAEIKRVFGELVPVPEAAAR